MRFSWLGVEVVKLLDFCRFERLRRVGDGDLALLAFEELMARCSPHFCHFEQPHRVVDGDLALLAFEEPMTRGSLSLKTRLAPFLPLWEADEYSNQARSVTFHLELCGLGQDEEPGQNLTELKSFCVLEWWLLLGIAKEHNGPGSRVFVSIGVFELLPKDPLRIVNRRLARRWMPRRVPRWEL